MCWLYDAGKVICYVRSRLWQNSTFIITVLSLFLFTSLQLPLAASMILGLNYARSDPRVVA